MARSKLHFILILFPADSFFYTVYAKNLPFYAFFLIPCKAFDYFLCSRNLMNKVCVNTVLMLYLLSG